MTYVSSGCWVCLVRLVALGLDLHRNLEPVALGEDQLEVVHRLLDDRPALGRGAVAAVDDPAGVAGDGVALVLGAVTAEPVHLDGDHGLSIRTPVDETFHVLGAPPETDARDR